MIRIYELDGSITFYSKRYYKRIHNTIYCLNKTTSNYEPIRYL